jgi:hypothetical protein
LFFIKGEKKHFLPFFDRLYLSFYYCIKKHICFQQLKKSVNSLTLTTACKKQKIICDYFDNELYKKCTALHFILFDCRRKNKKNPAKRLDF